MLSDRLQRQVERLLDEADEAIRGLDWATVRDRAEAVLAIERQNTDGQAYLSMALEKLEGPVVPAGVMPGTVAVRLASEPTSFASGRYEVKRFLGEGGKKKVYLAHDTKLDRDVAFAVIKTEGLDDAGRQRIQREAQAMGRLGAHPHIVSVFDLGEEAEGQPFIVTELMGGGDVEGLIERAPEHRVPLEQALRVADEVCQGLEYAHANNIVHRDLKPGNVWLTAEGRAKLGDFGLAVATDRSRLTQAGMMVGTVSYMPPEQAMGGEVTPRSDLYSLGAMLYELVTGRPPFIGDESVAIITQHLNTPPIAPSWHRPDLPLALEALILQLLEKDPARRPESASIVRQALENLSPSPSPARGGEPEGSGTSPSLEGKGVGGLGLSNPLYRRVFVGREAELQHLQQAFDAAISGRGALLTVVGEPGIGKTALCEQLATYVAMRGGRTLVGHAYEEGSLSLPYLPFVEAMRDYVLTRPAEALREELGTGAHEVARIVSEIRQQLGSDFATQHAALATQPAVDPEEERWRLFQAVTGFLRHASAVQPLVIVLEDLHWAERGTLELLLHLARNLQGVRLLVVATYRDIEVDRGHPLSAALAELRRISNFERVLLRGLTTPEVQRMLQGITGQDMRWAFAEAVQRQTEGNPLFVQEVIRYLAEEGLIAREEGRWQRTTATPLEMSIPEGLRDVIGKRLSRLSPACNQALSVAAVIGRDFMLETLRLLGAAPSDEVLLTALEEAVHVGVLEDQSRGGSVRFRFAHAFFRQTLYEEIFTPRRLRLHQEVARALEQQFRTRPEEHAAELAEHFSQSSDPGDLTKAVAYSQMAAGRSLGVYAYGDAVHHLQQALLAQEVLDPDDKATRCDLLLALGAAQMPLGEPLRVAEGSGPEAFALAEGLGDRARASRACRQVLEALHRDAPTNTLKPVWRDWAERADLHAGSGTVDRAYANVALARAAIGRGEQAHGMNLLDGALALARQLVTGGTPPDPPDAWELLFSCAWQIMRVELWQHWRRLPALAQEALEWPRDRVSSRTVGQVLEFGGAALLYGGDRGGAERAWDELSQLAGRTQDAFIQLNAMGFEGVLATLDGRLEEAEKIGQRALTRGDELGTPRVANLAARRGSARALLWLGHVERARAIYARLPGFDSTDALLLAYAGQHTESQEAIGAWLVAHPADQETPPVAPLNQLVILLEAALMVGDRDAAALLAGWLADPPLINEQTPTCPMRHVAAAAALLGDRARARECYGQALAAATQLRVRPEIALVRLQLAELLLEGSPGEQLEAQPHLDFAIEEFRAMKMQPFLERALRHKGLLNA